MEQRETGEESREVGGNRIQGSCHGPYSVLYRCCDGRLWLLLSEREKPSGRGVYYVDSDYCFENGVYGGKHKSSGDGDRYQLQPL